MARSKLLISTSPFVQTEISKGSFRDKLKHRLKPFKVPKIAGKNCKISSPQPGKQSSVVPAFRCGFSTPFGKIVQQNSEEISNMMQQKKMEDWQSFRNLRVVSFITYCITHCNITYKTVYKHIYVDLLIRIDIMQKYAKFFPKQTFRVQNKSFSSTVKISSRRKTLHRGLSRPRWLASAL